MVGISGLEHGALVAGRYRVVERLTRFEVAESGLAGVEYEYWLALDERRGAEVWIQLAGSRGAVASGAHLAGAVSALRRLDHRLVPAVLDFGEIEIDVFVADRQEAAVAALGYAVLEPIEGESLAAVLLRAAPTEAEILAVLIEIADVISALHEVELVHGHLSAHSFLLTEQGVILVDVAASLALEAVSDRDRTAAADVYALAWLACLSLVGVEVIEAEFGFGYETGSASAGSRTLELVERRRAWAASSLVEAYGIRAELAVLIVAALGEESGRPTAGALAVALRSHGRRGVAGPRVAAGAAAVGAGAILAQLASESAAEAGVSAAAGAVGHEAVAVAASGSETSIEAAVYASGTYEATATVVGAAAVAAGGAAPGYEAAAAVSASVGAAFAAGSAPRAAESAGRTASSRHRRPKSALYVAVVIVLLVIAVITWGLARGGSSPAAAQAGSPSAIGADSAPSSAAAAAAPATTAPQATPSTPPSSVRSSLPVPSPSAVFTVPGTPSQALQRIREALGTAQSSGELPGSAQAGISRAISILRQEVSSGGPAAVGIAQLRESLQAAGVSATLLAQINELIPYLVAHQGS